MRAAAAGGAALAGTLVVGWVVLASAEEDSRDGWVREPAGAKAPAHPGGDPSRGTVAAEPSLVATRSGRTCDEAFRRAEATRGPRG